MPAPARERPRRRGGTGGHVYPALAVATACRDRGDDVTFVGLRGGDEERAAREAGLAFVGVAVASSQRRRSWRTVWAAITIVRESWRIRRVVAAADVVVSVGGFAAAPAALAAGIRRRRLLVIEPNAVPGVVNRFTCRWAVAAATMFDATAPRLPAGVRVVRTGTPLRSPIAAVAMGAGPSREDAYRAFGLDAGRRTVFVFGGSQGALSLVRALAAALPSLSSRDDLQILVSTGRNHLGVLEDGIDTSASLVVVALPFIDRMDMALTIADLAVARAGGSVAELAACGVPAILAPYPFATDDHQRANAHELERLGAAIVIDDAALTGNALHDAILSVMDDEARRAAMARSMRGWARPEATASITELVHEVGR